MADYVDCMDPSRVVRPVQNTKSGTVECRVYWRQRVGDKEVRVFGGITNIPQNLFLSGEESEYSPRRSTGFLPEGKAAALPTKAKKARRAPKREERDEDYEE
ncbi:MAG TPA: hypothetical protein VM577_08255 [Anaerovoracaceae bacterium]|nr:hypothetical protein [Anaerovoracaceae bacterium]